MIKSTLRRAGISSRQVMQISDRSDEQSSTAFTDKSMRTNCTASPIIFQLAARILKRDTTHPQFIFYLGVRRSVTRPQYLVHCVTFVCLYHVSQPAQRRSCVLGDCLYPAELLHSQKKKKMLLFWPSSWQWCLILPLCTFLDRLSVWLKIKKLFFKHRVCESLRICAVLQNTSGFLTVTWEPSILTTTGNLGHRTGATK